MNATTKDIYVYIAMALGSATRVRVGYIPFLLQPFRVA